MEYNIVTPNIINDIISYNIAGRCGEEPSEVFERVGHHRELVQWPAESARIKKTIIIMIRIIITIRIIIIIIIIMIIRIIIIMVIQLHARE